MLCLVQLIGLGVKQKKNLDNNIYHFNQYYNEVGLECFDQIISASLLTRHFFSHRNGGSYVTAMEVATVVLLSICLTVLIYV